MNIIEKSGLPTRNNAPFNIGKFIDIMSLDKKNTQGKINLILLEKLGKAIKISDVSTEILENVINN